MTDAFTPERIAQLRGNKYTSRDFRAALDEIERLQDVNEELEQNSEIVSADFEKDCWRAMRKLLEMTGYDFTDEAVTADEAFEHLADDIKAGNAQLKLISAELSRVKAERDEAVDSVARVQSDREYVIGWNSGFEHAMDETLKMRFPTMLRKMWSGGEVQKWLDERISEARSFLSRMEGRKDG